MKTAVSVVLGLCLTSSYSFADCASSTCQSYKAEFEKVVEHYQRIYCYIEMKQKEYSKNFDKTATTYLGQIDDTMSADDYLWLLRRWAAEFNDGHVNFLAKRGGLDYRIFKFDIRTTPIEPATNNEKVIVSASKNSEIPLGSFIQKIDGKEIGQVVSSLVYLRSGSTETMRRRNVIGSLFSSLAQDTKKSDFKLEIQTPDNQIREVVIQGTESMFSKEPSPNQPNESITYSITEGGILVIQIDRFEYGLTEVEFNEMLRKVDLTKINGVLIDVRVNRGGSPASYEAMLRHFLDGDRKIETYQQSPRINDFTVHYRPHYAQWPMISGTDFGQFLTNSTFGKSVPAKITQPVVVLTSSYCFSACDTFVSALANNGLARIVGERTAGGTGSPIEFSLPFSKHTFRYSVVRGISIKGEQIEGKGTLPEIYIPQLAEDIRDQKDYQLATALGLFEHSKVLMGSSEIPDQKKPTENPLRFSEEAWETFMSGESNAGDR